MFRESCGFQMIGPSLNTSGGFNLINRQRMDTCITTAWFVEVQFPQMHYPNSIRALPASVAFHVICMCAMWVTSQILMCFLHSPLFRPTSRWDVSFYQDRLRNVSFCRMVSICWLLIAMCCVVSGNQGKIYIALVLLVWTHPTYHLF